MFRDTTSSRIRGVKFWSISQPPRMRTFSVQEDCSTTSAAMNGSRRRSLQAMVHHLPLQAHDRLEPCTSLADVGAIDSVTQLPLRTVWWRPSTESPTRHENPLLGPRFGLDPTQCLTADMLRAIFLGVMNSFCRRFLVLVAGRCVGPHVHTRGDHRSRDASGATQRHRMVQTSALRGPPQSALSVELTANNIGSASDPQLQTKGTETDGVYIWLVEQLAVRSQLDIEASALREASAELLRMVRLWRPFGRRGDARVPAFSSH